MTRMEREPDTAEGRVEAFIQSLEAEGAPRHTAEQIQAYLASVEADHPGTIAEMLALPERLKAEARGDLDAAPLDTGRWEHVNGVWRLLEDAEDAALDGYQLWRGSGGWLMLTWNGEPGWLTADDLEAAARIIRHQETKR